MIIAPTEPKKLRAIGHSPSKKHNRENPETYGVDILIEIERGVDKNSRIMRYGVQRKELKDFIASVQDGRLTTETRQMAQLDVAMLVIEGTPRWSLDGALLQSKFGARWSFQSHYKYLWSARMMGWWVEGTANLDDTIQMVKHFEEWCLKDEHDALLQRPGPEKNSYGRADDRAHQLHILQGFPGLGVGRAGAWLDHFGGTMLEWQVDVDEMSEVPGIGRDTAQKIWDAL